MNDGFDFSELEAFIETTTDNILKTGSKENKRFLKKQANKLKTMEKRTFKAMGAGIEETDTKKDKKIINRFKAGKTYDYNGELACRAYNGSPHAHLINNGFIHKPKFIKIKFLTVKTLRKLEREKGAEKFIPGYHFIEKAAKQYKSTFEEESERHLETIATAMLDK